MLFAENILKELEYYTKNKIILRDNTPYYLMKGPYTFEEVQHIQDINRIPQKRLDFQSFFRKHQTEFNFFADLLEDESSREFLKEVLLFQMLGHTKIRLRTNTEKLARTFERVRQNKLPRIQREKVSVNHVQSLFRYRFPFMDVITHDAFFLEVIVMNQYHLQTKECNICVEKGDIVLECGSEFGDVGLLFASRVGDDGKIFCFECSEINRRYLQLNLALNSQYKNIEVLPYAVSNKSGDFVSFSWKAGATQIGQVEESGMQEQAETISIDDFCEQKQLEQLDFIKMDIEGAERLALEGAQQSIRRFKPKMAIAAYHRPDDLLVLSKLILDIEPSYRFFLRHHSIHASETVIYAIPESRWKRE